VNVDPDEYEWLIFSEKRAWLIVYAYDAFLHVLRRPFIFRHYYDPVTDVKSFTAEFEDDGEDKELAVDISILDYSPHEIEGIVRLAYSRMGVRVEDIK
jgi:hypothetical protein